MSNEEYVTFAAHQALKQEFDSLLQRVVRLEQAGIESAQVARQKTLFSVITKIRESLDIDTIFRATATEIRQLLRADRVMIFRFDPGYNEGEVVAEDVLPEFASTLAAKVKDHCFGEHHAIYYQRGRVWAANDIQEANLPNCHLEILGRFQVRANLVVPLSQGGELWGLLCIHQCSGPRHWQGSEIEFVTQIAIHLGIALQQAELLARAERRSSVLQTTLEVQLRQRAEELSLEAERERAVNRIIDRIRQTLDIDTIFSATTQEVQNILNCDRVVMYQFFHDGVTKSVAESVAIEDSITVQDSIKTIWSDLFPYATPSHAFSHQDIVVVEDIYHVVLPPNHTEILEQSHIRAYVVVPVCVGDVLWGVLAAYQQTTSRRWEPGEVSLMSQIGNQLGVALQQAESIATLKIQSEQLARAVEREKAAASIIDKIRRSLDINTIFQTATQEARLLLKADRVCLYRFNEDWSGEFLVESVAQGWRSLLQVQNELPELHENISNCTVKALSDSAMIDTYLQDTDGGNFARGETFRICDDVYDMGFSECYLRLLEDCQAKAYVIVAIYQGQYLWGLLAAYQNSGPRHWQESDINFLLQVGDHLGVALQQAELLGQAQQQSTALQSRLEAQLRQRAEELVQEAERERTIAQVIRKIRQTLDIDTIFQTTATEVRQLLNADRVAMFRFLPDSEYSQGDIVAEAVLPGFSATLGLIVADHCFGTQYAKSYQQGRVHTISNVQTADLQPCYLKTLSQFQVKATLVVPLLKGDHLWGLLCIHQCSAPRQWYAKEIEFVIHIANHLGVGLQQADLLAQARQQSAELQKAKETADAANKAKSEFLAKISHELRTPLNAILGFTQLLIHDSSFKKEQREYLDIISRSGEHLLTLINDVLEMSKIEAGRVTLNESSFDLYNLLDSLEEMLQLKARSKDLELIFDRSVDIPQYIHADESKLRQVLINLLGNAIKFTQTGRVILRVRGGDWEIKKSKPEPEPFSDLSLKASSEPFSQPSSESKILELATSELKSPESESPEPDPSESGHTDDACSPFPHTLYFEVEDTGSGIEPSELERLFEAFVQAESGRRSQEGTGLGLPISRQFIWLMGGDIRVSSAIGQGSTFQFHIPIRRTEHIPLPSQPHRQRVVGLAPHQSTYRILIVEDKLENRQLLVKLLTGIGFIVQEAVNGEGAIEIWETWHPHLIWMDMQMPVMDGYEATRQIRRREQRYMRDSSYSPTIIIALTAHAFEENRDKVLAAGCDDCVTKPFREDVLFAKMTQHLGTEYVYEQNGDTQQEQDLQLTSIDMSMVETELMAMPSDWITLVYQAATQVDDELILQLIDRIPESQSILAIALTRWVTQLRFDKIIELVEQLIQT